MGKSQTLVCLLLAAAVFLCFAPSLRNGFVGYDDNEYVTDNPHVNTGLSRQNIAWAFTTAHSSNWHPLTWISHSLDCTWYGLRPAGHHLTSLLFHVANTVLLFLWLAAATGFRARSVFVALVFGLHPLHVESVAWIAERKDVLSTFFGLLTLIAYAAYVRKPAVARYCLVAVFFDASLLSKPMLVTLPLVLSFLDWWPLHRSDRRLAILDKLPLLVLSALSTAATLWAQRQAGSIAAIGQLPLSLRLPNAALSYVRYLGKTIWPVDLAVFYPFHAIPAWMWIVSFFAMSAICGLAFALRRKHPWIAVGWCWYLLTLLPVIGIVQVGMQSMADRYMYIPMVGLLIALAWTAGQAPMPAWLLRAAAGVAVAACALLSWRQIPVWKDGLTLFTHAVAVTRDNFVAHDNLGVELDRRGRFEEALQHYRETLRIQPGDRHGEANYAQASFAKGQRLFDSGSLDDALATFRDGLRVRPQNAFAHTQIGKILTQQHRLPEALAELRTAIQLDPAMADAHMGLGVALAWSGRAGEAAQAFENTLRYDPRNVEAHYDLGLVRAAMGRHAVALESFDAAVKLKPEFGPAQVARAETLYALGRYEEAARAVQAARAAHAEVDPQLAGLLAARLRK